MAKFTPSTVFLLLLVLLTTVEAVAPEFKPCKTASNKFKGACFSSSNCESICKTEGHVGGGCEGFRRRCICTRPCF
ncbi:low-molecular-weight cysteine-rich 66, PLANT DEFENSIN 2.4 [Hibiscus trionum]|uniref:Low-molecular-weight cysteine-rich 66, PLANT DEFENSIN 2.4 n=1 Tax=Hibiscus trionum TaxID=183268 RepID=A0A9W7MFT5_HIBTR|nr:low-molecular-weight cysteine-rich 66, PLANT DEFENSIN 2.4 [Hibiscus trionum]